MADFLSKEERSKRMSSIRGKWTKPEKIVHNYLKGNKIKHEMHPIMEGSPDIILKDRKVAIFIHGCFWHGCPKCYKEPKSNKDFWITKVSRNIDRDRQKKEILEKNGWKVMIIWEHEIKNINKLLSQIGLIELRP